MKNKMRVLHISDLHIDVNSRILQIEYKKLEKQILDYFKLIKDNFDIIFIVGDISNNMITSIKFLEKLEQKIGKKVLFVPGNHDISRDRFFKVSSETMYNFYKNSKYNLYDNPYKLTDDLYVVGGLGWYDYSFYIDFLGKEAEKINVNSNLKSVKQTMWYDGKNIDFKKDDIKIFQNEINTYIKHLDNIKSLGKNVWLMNHFVPYRQFIEISKVDSTWNECNGFMGSSKLGELIDEYNNVKYVSFGHTHNRFGKVKMDEKYIICNPLGYVGEWETDNILAELKKLCIIVEV